MFIIKMIFLWWLWLWYIWRIAAFARKYRIDPNFYPPQQRNDWLLKKAKFLLWFFGVKIVINGYENLPKGPVLLCPNHKSNLDPIIVFAALARQVKTEGELNKIPTFLAKIEISKNWLAKRALSLLDTFYIDRNNIKNSLKSLNEFGSFVKRKLTYGVVFPEGTRIKQQELGEFKSGAFSLAIKNYLPIVPVAISDTRDALNVRRFKKLVVNISFLNTLKPNNFITMQTNVIAEKVKTQIEEVLNAK